jgi:hypothetical protein
MWLLRRLAWGALQTVWQRCIEQSLGRGSGFGSQSRSSCALLCRRGLLCRCGVGVAVECACGNDDEQTLDCGGFGHASLTYFF